MMDRMNELYKVWVVLKSMLSNGGYERNAKKCLFEGVIVCQQRCMEQRHANEKCREQESECS